jgi:predicted RNA-binding protein with PIN domain
MDEAYARLEHARTDFAAAVAQYDAARGIPITVTYDWHKDAGE